MRFFEWGFLLLFAATHAKIPHYNPEVCGRKSKYSSLVLTDSKGRTGHPTHLAPWAVQIRAQSENGDFAVICGGTLISEKHILTAAHCFRRESGKKKLRGFCEENSRLSDSEILSKTKVTVGAMCTKMFEKYGCKSEVQLGKTMNVKRFAIGDFYKTNCEKGNDIVILEMDGTLEGLEVANYACLPFDVQLDSGLNVTSFGWGSDPVNGFDYSMFPMIQVMDLVPESSSSCEDKWGNEIPSDAFCTVETRKKNVCRGDSGGGLTFLHEKRQHLLAIVSYGSDCGDLLLGAEPISQVNTDIRKHQKFILDFMNQ